MWRVGNAVVTMNKGRASEDDCDGTRRCGDSADAAHRAALNDHMAELTALVLVLERRHEETADGRRAQAVPRAPRNKLL